MMTVRWWLRQHHTCVNVLTALDTDRYDGMVQFAVWCDRFFIKARS